MKFRISTLILLVTIVALVFGWHCERLKTEQNLDKWNAEIKGAIIGAHTLGEVRRTTGIAQSVEGNPAAIRIFAAASIIQLWRNEEQIIALREARLSGPDLEVIHKLKNPHIHQQVRSLMKWLDCGTTGEFLEVCHQVDIHAGFNHVDSDSPEFKSLDVFITRCLGAN